MNTYVISLEGQSNRTKGNLPLMMINSFADSCIEACETARTIVSTFTHHEYSSVQWRIERLEDDSANLEITYKDIAGQFHRFMFGRCERKVDHTSNEMPRLRLVVGN